MLWGILPPAKALQSKVAPGRGPHKTAVRFFRVRKTHPEIILPPAKALQAKVAPGRGPHKTAVRFSGSGKRTLKTFSLQRKLYSLKFSKSSLIQGMASHLQLTLRWGGRPRRRAFGGDQETHGVSGL